MLLAGYGFVPISIRSREYQFALQARKVDPCVKTLEEAVVRATFLLFFVQNGWLFRSDITRVSENRLLLAFGSQVLDEAVCDCKTQSSCVSENVPPLVTYTHVYRPLPA